MIKTERTIDDVFNMCDSRYELVNLIAQRARVIAEDPNKRGMVEKPVNVVLDNLLVGRSVICKANSAATLYSEGDFELTVSADTDYMPSDDEGDEE